MEAAGARVNWIALSVAKATTSRRSKISRFSFLGSSNV